MKVNKAGVDRLAIALVPAALLALGGCNGSGSGDAAPPTTSLTAPHATSPRATAPSPRATPTFVPIHVDATTGAYATGAPATPDTTKTDLPFSTQLSPPAGTRVILSMTGAQGQSDVLTNGVSYRDKSADFTTTGPWAVRYSFDCSQNPQGQHGAFAVDVKASSSDPSNDPPLGGFSHGQNTSRDPMEGAGPSSRGTGTKVFPTPGHYYLLVYLPADCTYDLSVFG